MKRSGCIQSTSEPLHGTEVTDLPKGQYSLRLGDFKPLPFHRRSSPSAKISRELMRRRRDARGRTVNLTRLTTYVSESKIDTQVVKKLNFALGNRILE